MTKIIELDPVTLDSLTTLRTEEFGTEFPIIPGQIAYIPDNKLLFYAFKFYSASLYSDKTYLVDLINKQILDSAYYVHQINYIWVSGRMIEEYTDAYSIKDLSTDGNYVLLYYQSISNINFLYDISDDSFRQVCEISHHEVCFYNPANCFIEATDGKIILRNNTDGSVNKEIFLGFSNLYNPVIDPVTNYLGGIDPDSSYYTIIDIPSSQIIKRIKIDNIYLNLCLLNSTLFSQSGFYMPIEW